MKRYVLAEWPHSQEFLGHPDCFLIHIPDENAYVGRTYMDAPGIDGNIFINSGELLMTGDFVKVRVTGSFEYDLIGEII